MDSVLAFAGTLDRRFFSTVWLPLHAFVVALACSVLDWRGLLGVWSAAPAAELFAVAVGVLAATTAAAYVLSVLLPSVYGLFEGRWMRAVPAWEARAVARQGARRARMQAGVDRDVALALFPPDAHSMTPSALGNVLRSAELHPWVRYRLDAVVSWPRLFECLPERIVKQLAAEKAQLDLIVVLSLLSGAYGPVAALAAAAQSRWWAAAAFLVAGILLSRILYLVAVQGAVSYGLVIRAAYDVHRFRMLDALDWARPTSWAEERRQWQAVTRLWLRGAVGSHADADALGYPAERLPDDGFWRRLWSRIGTP